LPTANRSALGIKVSWFFLIHGLKGLKGFFVLAEGGAELVMSVEGGFVLLDFKEWFAMLSGGVD